MTDDASKKKPAAKKPAAKKVTDAPVRAKKVQYLKETRVAKVRKYKPTGNAPGRPKAVLGPEDVKEGVRPSWQLEVLQGRRQRAELRKALPGIDAYATQKTIKKGKPEVVPIETAQPDEHQHDWETIHSMKSPDSRVATGIANRLNIAEMQGSRRYNFRPRNVGHQQWQVQRQPAFCADCDPKSPSATEKPPTGLLG